MPNHGDEISAQQVEGRQDEEENAFSDGDESQLTSQPNPHLLRERECNELVIYVSWDREEIFNAKFDRSRMPHQPQCDRLMLFTLRNREKVYDVFFYTYVGFLLDIPYEVSRQQCIWLCKEKTGEHWKAAGRLEQAEAELHIGLLVKYGPRPTRRENASLQYAGYFLLNRMFPVEMWQPKGVVGNSFELAQAACLYPLH